MDMIGLKDKIINIYINNFHKSKFQNRSLRKLRNKSISFFDKNIKYTDFYYVFNDNFILLNDLIINKLKLQNITSILYYICSYRLVYIDGMFAPSLSKTSYKRKEILILSHLFVYKKYNSIIDKYYGQIIYYKHNLSQLNTVFSFDGSYIYIPDNLLVEKPIQIMYLTTGYNFKYSFIFPRNLIIIGKNARLNIIESHQSIYIHNSINISVTEIYSHYNSYLEYFKIKNDIYKSTLIDYTYIIQNSYSFINMNTYSFNGFTITNYLGITHCGEGIISHLNGLTLIEKKSFVSHNIYIDHTYSQCKSYEFYKGILLGKSYGRFDGKIVVRKNTNKIDAFQINDNMLLSKESFINSNPTLNIYSKEVKCSHACTIGILDDMSLFYLMSRGILEKKAIIYLIISFVCDILENILFVIFKKEIYHIIINKLNVISKRYL
jgi:Fe-S cluster assembly protein SufD